MVVSILLSGLIYYAVSNEVSGGLTNLGERIISKPDKTTQDQIIKIQSEEAERSHQRLAYYLYILNLLIFILGGVSSYMIAKKIIKTIETTNKAQARFITDASHELRTPLAAMKSEIEASLYDKKITKKELQSTLKSTVEEVDKMSGLTAMLLDLSRVNTLNYDVGPVEVNHAIQSVVDRSSDQTRLKYTCTRPAYIKGNELALETVFNIIIENALKYSLPKSKVEITVSQSSQKVYVKISNQGRGIAPEDIDHIFEQFYRGYSDTKKLPGYGMGLALAREIVEHHSGHIDVKSTTDELTIFTVVLPKNSRSLSVLSA